MYNRSFKLIINEKHVSYCCCFFILLQFLHLYLLPPLPLLLLLLLFLPFFLCGAVLCNIIIRDMGSRNKLRLMDDINIYLNSQVRVEYWDHQFFLFLFLYHLLFKTFFFLPNKKRAVYRVICER